MTFSAHRSMGFFSVVAFGVGSADAAESSTKEQVRVARVAATFADCVINRNAPVVRAMILEGVSNTSIFRDGVKLLDEYCLLRATGPTGDVTLSFSYDYFPYTLAEGLVRRDYPSASTFEFSKVPALTRALPESVDPDLVGKTNRKAKDAQEQYDKKNTFYALSKWAECVVRQDPSKAHALLLTEIGSTSEGAAISALSQAFGDCLDIQQIKITRTLARGALAVNFYRLAGAPAGASVKRLKAN